MKKLGLIATIAVMAGCSTLTTTTASVTFLHSPPQAGPMANTASGLIVGGQLLYEVDRGQSRLGGCGIVGRQMSDPPMSESPKDDYQPFNVLQGSFCHKSDIGHGVYARSLEERWMRERQAEPSN